MNFMNKPLMRVVDLGIRVLVLLLLFFEAWQEGRTRIFLQTLGFIVLAIGLLVLLDRRLQRRKTPQWMSRYHVGLAVLFVVAVVGLCVIALRLDSHL